MVSQISAGVKITVETFYQPEYSNPLNSEFMFAYKITIENNNLFPIKLLSRHWQIYDSNGSVREVEGDGVVGMQPKIATNGMYEYISGCNLRSELGKMQGTYLMENVHTGKTFTVIVPTFEMCVPFKMN
ncbi:MAG: Co2+/Mg2+ efflux protein ApaG [Bacteroidetes bacterium]|nr:Co2+/Mg2+ efflux protein ApaG [Bacteroidota bacterium]MBS1758275.1 Co2+/Mg2+ efflux protein ApaG [Bacteroidota bacterium]